MDVNYSQEKNSNKDGKKKKSIVRFDPEYVYIDIYQKKKKCSLDYSNINFEEVREWLDHFLLFDYLIERLIEILRERIHNDYEIERSQLLVCRDIILPFKKKHENKSMKKNISNILYPFRWLMQSDKYFRLEQ